jgi:hypothetical protein
MLTVILQIPPTFETRQIKTAAMLSDDICCLNASLAQLSLFGDQLKAGALPVGSVEFVRAAMALAEVPEPPNLSYATEALSFLHRDVSLISAERARRLGPIFVKPVETKLFTGFVFDGREPRASLSSHTLDQLRVFEAMPADASVWVSTPVAWLSEWRYYVQEGVVRGKARYDSEDDEDAPLPDFQIVQECIKALSIKHPFAIDLGVLSTGQTALVEVNDAWAIGLYSGALSPREYFEFLHARWASLA